MQVLSCLSIALDMAVGHGFAEHQHANDFPSISLAAAKQVLMAVAARNAENSGFSAFVENLFLNPI